jgi:hypothetical protein
MKPSLQLPVADILMSKERQCSRVHILKKIANVQHVIAAIEV